MFLLSWITLEINKLYRHLFNWFACLACLLLALARFQYKPFSFLDSLSLI